MGPGVFGGSILISAYYSQGDISHGTTEMAGIADENGANCCHWLQYLDVTTVISVKIPPRGWNIPSPWMREKSGFFVNN
jgi:hypothetical protein